MTNSSFHYLTHNLEKTFKGLDVVVGLLSEACSGTGRRRRYGNVALRYEILGPVATISLRERSSKFLTEKLKKETKNII